MDALIIEAADPTAPDVAALIEAHVARSRAHYPVTSCHSFEVAEIADAGIAMVVGRVGGEAVAIGGLADLGGGEGELKSMFTAQAARGRGYGRALVAHLIEMARSAGMTRLSLETGIDDASAAARAVYGKLGFSECGTFGSYSADPLSTYMTRAL